MAAYGPPDPTPPGALPYADILNPQSFNKYQYGYNNPLRYIDPTGHIVALDGSPADKEEEKKRIVMNASKKGEAALFKTVTNKQGQTRLVLDKEAAAKFQGKHSEGYKMIVQTINAARTVSVHMTNVDSFGRGQVRTNKETSTSIWIGMLVQPICSYLCETPKAISSQTLSILLLDMKSWAMPG